MKEGRRGEEGRGGERGRPNCRMPFSNECLVSMRDAESHMLYEFGIFTQPGLRRLGEFQKGDYVETYNGYDKVVSVEKLDTRCILYPLFNVFALRCTGDVSVYFGGEWLNASEISPPIRQGCDTLIDIYTELYNDIVVDGVTCIQSNNCKVKNVTVTLRGMTGLRI
jgi:hypothetical protein